MYFNSKKMTKKLSKSGLSIILSKLNGFNSPNVRAEQYEIDSEIAGSVLWDAYIRGKVSVKSIADLGSGTGILGIGALILGAKLVYFVDSDENSLKIAKNNLEYVKSESSYSDLINGKAVFICKDIANFNEKVDTIIMNPPFGVKVRHADKLFLEKAVKIADTIYSFHKSESNSFILAFTHDNSFKVRERIDFSWPLKQTMKFHRKRIKRINVSCFVLEKD